VRSKRFGICSGVGSLEPGGYGLQANNEKVRENNTPVTQRVLAEETESWPMLPVTAPAHQLTRMTIRVS
jgi:hypothetical protein